MMTLGPQFEQLQLFDPGPATPPAPVSEAAPTETTNLKPEGEQLKMFMSPSEINPSGSVDAPWTKVAERHKKRPKRTREMFTALMNEKTAEAAAVGLTEDIRRRGVVMPVQVIHTPELGRTLGHGNHRFAAAMAINPDMLIPIHHTEGTMKDISYGNKTMRELDWWPADAEYREMHGKRGVLSYRGAWA